MHMNESTTKSLTRKMTALQHEIRVLRSVMIGMVGHDAEGEYKIELVKEVLQKSKEATSHKYMGRGSLTADLKIDR